MRWILILFELTDFFDSRPLEMPVCDGLSELSKEGVDLPAAVQIPPLSSNIASRWTTYNESKTLRIVVTHSEQGVSKTSQWTNMFVSGVCGEQECGIRPVNAAISPGRLPASASASATALYRNELLREAAIRYVHLGGGVRSPSRRGPMVTSNI